MKKDLYSYILKNKYVIELYNGTTESVYEIKSLQETSFKDHTHIYHEKFNNSFIRTRKWLKENHPELLI